MRIHCTFNAKMVCNGNFVMASYYRSNIMLVILTTIFIKVTLCLSDSVDGEIRSSESNVCAKPVCLETAESIRKAMNTENKPCSNFYLFACGTYLKEADVPRGQGLTSVIKEIENEAKKKLKIGFHRKRNSTGTNLRTFQLLKSYYKVCLNSRTPGAIQEQKNFALSIFKTLGGWPLLEGKYWDETKFDWKEFNYNIRQLGLTEYTSAFIKLAGIPFKIKVEGPIFIHLKNDLKNELLETAKYFGADELEVDKEFEELKNFITQLEKIGNLKLIKKRNNPTLEYVAKKSKIFPWFEYLSKFLPSNIKLDPNTKVYVDLKNFTSLMDVINNTSKRVVANQVFWHLATELRSILEDDVSIVKQNYYVTPKEGHRLWKYCINYVMDYMPVATGALYARKHFNKSWKIGVQNIAENLLDNFKRFVQKTTSMTNTTKMAALKKLDSLHPQVAYTEELLSDEKVEYYFKSLNDSSGNFLQNHLALMAFKNRHKIENNYGTHWTDHADVAKVDARYMYKTNSLRITASIIHNKLFNLNKPSYLNYAGIGKILGHEIGHSMDSKGKNYNENGEKQDWWDEDDRKKVEVDEECLIKQYSKYNASKEGLLIDGEITLNENIADHIGIKLAYTAYDEWIKENGEEPGLPGLPFTPRQLFWLNAAHTTCHRLRRHGWNVSLADEHTPGPFRVIVPFSNMPEFARDFNCPAGSRMNPIEKCEFWWDRQM